MLTLGITCPPIPGHLNPMLALGAELRRRGHRVIMLSLADVAEQARARGLEIGVLGRLDCPPGWLRDWHREFHALEGSAAMFATADLLATIARVVLRDTPALIRSLGIDGLIIDQVEYGGSSVAQRLDLPYVTVANGFPVNREPAVPSIYTDWLPRSGLLGRQRDLGMYRLSEPMYRFTPIGRLVNAQRKRMGLPPFKWESDGYSPFAQLSQCPEAFDFPRQALPAVWHGVGPIRSDAEPETPFPFERLDGRPLVYGSLGSLQGNKRALFAAMAEACAPLGVQLVITHGHQLRDDETRDFAGQPLVVPYAPQRALLERACLVITHAGMNTVLDSLSAGVPMVAIPILFEQPAIAARVAWHGVGEAVPLRRVSTASIRSAVERILADSRYHSAAERFRSAIAAAGGVGRAADVIERVVSTRAPVSNRAPVRALGRAAHAQRAEVFHSQLEPAS